ncbi:MAG: hypothetical protein AUJ85_06245 [Elusimicrobia bacterium CG1_02_37_114]|nr:MAG: hypothetical protein AUJ85_06245 [Elusimicrobia bacterium CG1_02_37_114]
MANKILIIEDEENITQLLKVNLAGFVIENAYTGREGWKKISLFKPDLVILDLRLPGISGWDIFQKIKAKPEHDKIKVIILTASDHKENREKAVALNVDAFFSKPIDIQIFVQKVQNLLNV